MDQGKGAPIIIIKKKVKGHGGHHGGAWKVAYADFVTAMMALFIVLWLLSSSNEATKQAIAGYFNDPRGFADKSGTAASGVGDSIDVQKQDLEKLKDKLEGMMKQEMPSLGKDLGKQIEITLTSEGLRIELLEADKNTFFESGSSTPTKEGSAMISKLGGELAQMKNPIMIEGHTDARPFASKADYTNWELSADRANAARRTILAAGLDPKRISQIRGYADQRLRTPKQPEQSSNRRVSVLVQFMPGTGAQTAPAKGGHDAPSGHGTAKPAAGHASAPAAKPASGGH